MSAIQTNSELKALRSRLVEITAELASARQKMTEAQKEFESKRAKHAELEQRVKALEDKPSAVVISEHAYLRWFERALGFDLNDVAKAMLSEQNIVAIQAMGTCKISKPDLGLVLIVKDRTVVSVVDQ